MRAARATIAAPIRASVYKALVAKVETGLTPAERISLIGDEWAQVRANKATVGDYLDLVTAVKSRSERGGAGAQPLDGINAIMSGLRPRRREGCALPHGFARTFAPEYAKLGPPAAERLAEYARTARRNCSPCWATTARTLRFWRRRAQLRASTCRSRVGGCDAGPDGARRLPPATATRRSLTSCRRSTRLRPIRSSRRARCAAGGV